MGVVETAIEITLVCLLGATLVYAIRLHRAIATLRQDRGSLESAVAGFDSGTRQAEAGLARLREAAQHMAGQLSQAVALRDDLVFLSERGEHLADRLDTLVRAGRTIEVPLSPPPPLSPPAPLRPTQDHAHPASAPSQAHAAQAQPTVAADAPVVRSQAERNLLQALRGTR